jgi:hypothetical protein
MEGGAHARQMVPLLEPVPVDVEVSIAPTWTG